MRSLRAMRALVLQHAAPEGPGHIADALARHGVPVRTVRIDRGEPVPTLGGASGLVVVGGPMGVYEPDRHPHLDAERDLVRDALDADVPVLGVCLGSQLLARALGAEVRPGPAPEIGWARWRPCPVRRRTRCGSTSRRGSTRSTGTATCSACPRGPSRWRGPGRPTCRRSGTAGRGAPCSTARRRRPSSGRWPRRSQTGPVSRPTCSPTSKPAPTPWLGRCGRSTTAGRRSWRRQATGRSAR